MFIFNLLLGIVASLLSFETAPPGGGTPASGEPETKPDPKPDATGGAAGADDGSGGGEAGDAGKEPSGEDKAVQRANAQAAAARVALRDEKGKNQKLLTALRPALDALGIKVEGSEADPTELAKQVTSWQNKYKTERMTNAVLRLASAENARPEATMRYLRGGEELKELDPESTDFEQELKSIVQAAVANEPSLKVAQAGPTRSGADFTGSGSSKSLDEQIAEAEKAGDYKLSMRLKLAKANTQTGAVAT